MSTTAEGNVVPTDRHESVMALLAAHKGYTDPKKLIRQLAREKIDYAKQNGWSGPPFCPILLASIFGIRCKKVDHDIDGDGRILRYRDGKLWIEYRGDRIFERQRFTIFHEFAHTLFPDYCTFGPQHHTPHKAARDPEKEFENLCDVAAAEMILPFHDFSDDLTKHKWLGIETVHKLRQRYEASIDATTHRLIELSEGTPCGAVFLTDQKGSHSGYGPLWVKYSQKNSLFKCYVPAGTSVPRTSIATRCYQNSIATTEPGKETWWINGQPRTWLVQAAKLPSTDNPGYSKVVALLLPQSHGKLREV